MNKILVVEDSEAIIMGLKYSLEQEQYDVTVAKSVAEAKKLIDENDYYLILLDVTLPDGNGFEICKYAKSKNENIPIIFLTARDEETNVVMGLDMGADDYVVKPFRVRELMSRIASVLRRYEKNTSVKVDNQITIRNVIIDTNRGKVFVDGNEVLFTSLEYKLLLLMFSNKNMLITREMMIDKIWDTDGNFVNDNTLTVYVKRIREKIGDTKENSIIQTVRGIGYRVNE